MTSPQTAAVKINWARNIRDEPPLHQVLGDPIITLLMQRDGVNREQLYAWLATARQAVKAQMV